MELPASFSTISTVGTPLAEAPPLTTELQLAGHPASWLPVDTGEPTLLLFLAPESTEETVQPLLQGLAKQNLNLLVVRPVGPTLADYISSGRGLVVSATEFLAQQGADNRLFLYAAGASALPGAWAVAAEQKRFKGLFLEGAVMTDSPWLSTVCAIEEPCPAWQETLLAAMREITKATMIFHGSRDPYTPVASAERIQSESGARSKQFFVIPGGREPGAEPLCMAGGVPWFEAVRRFINTVCGINTWRDQRRKRRTSAQQDG